MARSPHLVLGSERLDVFDSHWFERISEMGAQIGCNRRYFRIAELLASAVWISRAGSL